MSRTLILVSVLALAVACGGGASPSAPSRPTAASISIQAADLPRGMVRCDLSGDIKTFIAQERTGDQSTGGQAATQWAQMQAAGATDAYVAVYTSSDAACASLKSPSANPTVASYKLVVSFVVQFNDEKAAAGAYTGGSIFGASPASLRSSQSIEGTKTGLSPNSIVVNQPMLTQTFFIALWQNKAFAVYLNTINVDPAASQKIALAENARIK